MPRVLLNVDLGELPDEPEELYVYAHVGNVACGGHAGDEATMREAVERCRRHTVELGAHPSYLDRSGFGRRTQDVLAPVLQAEVRRQCELLAEVASRAGARVVFVKAHGALYHDAQRDLSRAEALANGAIAALGEDVTFIGPARSELARVVARAGARFLREAFADRALRADGSLVPRGEPGALIADPVMAARQAARLVEQGEAETICVHGDSPGAVNIARAVRLALDRLAQG